MEKLGSAITIETKATMPMTQPLALDNSKHARILRLDEYKEAAHTLAEAFFADDVAMYFIETGDRVLTPKQKWDLHVSILEKVVYAHCLRGLATTVGPNYDCVALCGMWRLSRELSAEGRKRFFDEFLPLLHDTKYEVLGPLDSDSWYLVYIGAKNDSRGKGYARVLIDSVKKQADITGHTIYLESSNDRNPVIYGKLGFEMVKKISLKRAPKPIDLDIMIRSPKPLTFIRDTDSLADGECLKINMRLAEQELPHVV